MNKQNYYQQRMIDVILEFERAHTIALADELNKYRSSVEKLLDNGRPIFEQAIGKSAKELYEQRRKLWHKIGTIDNCINILYKHTH